MRPDLSKKNFLLAKRLLATVLRCGSLTAAAVALGLSRRGACDQWRRWGLQEDCPLLPRVGVPRHLRGGAGAAGQLAGPAPLPPPAPAPPSPPPQADASPAP